MISPELTAETWRSVDELAKTFNCKTPGCDGEARAPNGRHAYCRDCQIRRGTRREDGSFVAGRIPTAPGSRSSRNRVAVHGPFEARAMELVTAARMLDSVIARQKMLRIELREAVAAWRDVIERLPNVALPGDAVRSQAAGER